MKTRIAAVAAVLLLALTGCAGTPDETPSEPASAARTASESPESPAPLEAASATERPADTPEAAYVAKVREALGDDSQIPDATDAQLLTAGEDACQQLAEGKTLEEVRVIEGEQPDGLGWYNGSTKIASIANQTLCG